MKTQTRTYFILVFVLTWGIGGLGLLAGHWFPEWGLTTSSALYYVAAYSVSLTGLALTFRYDGVAGLRRLGQRLIPWHAPLWAYLLVLAGFGGITLFALKAGGAPQMPQWPVVLTALITAIARDPGPLGEEFGWRGFALPRMLERLSPMNATVRLGLLHAAWHLPLFFIPGMPQASTSLPLFVVGVLALATFDTALYLHTRPNLLLAILVHLLSNVGGGLVGGSSALKLFMVGEGVVAVAVIAFGGLKVRVSRPRP